MSKIIHPDFATPGGRRRKFSAGGKKQLVYIIRPEGREEADCVYIREKNHVQSEPGGEEG